MKWARKEPTGQQNDAGQRRIGENPIPLVYVKNTQINVMVGAVHISLTILHQRIHFTLIRKGPPHSRILSVTLFAIQCVIFYFAS